MTIFSEEQIIYLAHYFFAAHSFRMIMEPEKYPESLKPVTEIAHQLRTNNTDAYALYQVISDWAEGLADPMLTMIENLLDYFACAEERSNKEYVEMIEDKLTKTDTELADIRRQKEAAIQKAKSWNNQPKP